jgi:hypothetical protein
MKPNLKKIQIIKKWKKSTIAKGVRSFLGLVSFYKKIMKDFFDVGQTTFRPPLKIIVIECNMNNKKN